MSNIEDKESDPKGPKKLKLGEGLKALRQRHPIAITSAYILIVILILMLFLRIIGEFCVFINYHGITKWDDMATWSKLWPYVAFFGHANTIDLLAAVAAILIGILISIIVEDSANTETETLRHTTGNIEAHVKRIVREHIGIKTIDNSRELYKEIYGGEDVDGKTGVISHAIKQKNDLYIMNPTAWFGYWLNLDETILFEGKDGKFQEFSKNFTHKNAFDLWTRKNNQRLEALHKLNELQNIERVGKDNPRPKVKYLTLSVTTKNGIKRDYDMERECWEGASLIPYIREFAGFGLQKTTVYECLSANDNDPLFPKLKEKRRQMESQNTTKDNILLLSFPEKFKDIDVANKSYLHVFGNSAPEIDNNKSKAKLALHLLCRQHWDLHQLKDHGVDVRQCAEVPFQMFVSIPLKKSDNEWSTKAVIIFSNKYTIGTPYNVTAISTQDHRIAEMFVTIFNQLWPDATQIQESEPPT